MWIKSYFTQHKQKAKLDHSFSDAFWLHHGGAPPFYPLHEPLSNIISSFNATHNLYADDTHIYI